MNPETHFWRGTLEQTVCLYSTATGYDVVHTKKLSFYTVDKQVRTKTKETRRTIHGKFIRSFYKLTGGCIDLHHKKSVSDAYVLRWLTGR